MAKNNDFDKSTPKGLAAFRAAMASAEGNLKEHRLRLLDEIIAGMVEYVEQLHAEGNIEIEVVVEWPVASDTFKTEVLAMVQNTINKEGNFRYVDVSRGYRRDHGETVYISIEMKEEEEVEE